MGAESLDVRFIPAREGFDYGSTVQEFFQTLAYGVGHRDASQDHDLME
jgi:hypothetical protein